MTRFSRFNQPVNACQASTPVVGDGELRPKLQRLNPQDDKECCKENLARGSGEYRAEIRRDTDLGAANFLHRRIKGYKITRPKPDLASLVIGHMLKVFNSRGVIEEVTHWAGCSRAFASRRTSSAEMRLESP